jgi:hypothetical protein
MSTVVDLPVDVSGPLPLGESGAPEGHRAPLLVERGAVGRDLIGVARLYTDESGELRMGVEVDAATADALRFGSVVVTAVDLDGGDVVEGALDGWRLASAMVARRCVEAAVHRDGWADLPLADRERPWDEAAADRRIASACRVDRDDDEDDRPDWQCYGSAHLYRDDEANPETKGAYKMLLADVVDGRRVIVPRAVFSAAGVLRGAMVGIDAPAEAIAAMRTVLSGLYRRMADQWDDEDVRAPWDRDSGD